MSSSVKRFELFRMLFAIAIALLVSFGIIFLVSSQPLTAIYTLITGPFKSRRNFANVIEAMIPLIFTGTGVCIMFSANQINLAGEGAFHIGGLVSAVVALELGLSAGLSQAVAILLSGLAGAVFTAVHQHREHRGDERFAHAALSADDTDNLADFAVWMWCY